VLSRSVVNIAAYVVVDRGARGAIRRIESRRQRAVMAKIARPARWRCYVYGASSGSAAVIDMLCQRLRAAYRVVGFVRFAPARR